MEQINYEYFLKTIEKTLSECFELQKEHIHCKKGCSICCEQGDYPLSDLELYYLMKGYSQLDHPLKIEIQNNIKTMQRGGKCPFLLKNECSVYSFRPLICRVHGLAYVGKNGVVKIPYCARLSKNFSDYYKNGEFLSEPIKKNFDEILNIGEIRSLYDWIFDETVNNKNQNS